MLHASKEALFLWLFFPLRLHVPIPYKQYTSRQPQIVIEAKAVLTVMQVWCMRTGPPARSRQWLTTAYTNDPKR